MGSEEILRDVLALERGIATLVAAEQEAVGAVEVLEAELVERRNRLLQARQTIGDLQDQIEQKRAELEEAIAEEARERFEEVMRQRDAAAASLAEAIEQLLERLAATLEPGGVPPFPNHRAAPRGGRFGSQARRSQQLCRSAGETSPLPQTPSPGPFS